MKKVLILFGGNSYEHEISIMSLNFLIKNIDKDLFDFKVVGIDYDNEWYLVSDSENFDKNWKSQSLLKINNIIEFAKSFDIVFPIIHGNTLEDGKLQGMFDLFNIKYVGSNSISSLISYDKMLTKLVLEKSNIPQVPYIVYHDNIDTEKIKYPVIVKPCKCGSSIGINVAYTKRELKKYIKEARKYDDNVLIEKYIKNNRELECAILEDNKNLIISDIGEIINNDGWYDYKSKYVNKIDTKISSIDDSIKENIKKYAKNIFLTLKCKNLSRIDFLYDLDEKKLYFNEINTMPGFTEISMYPKLIHAAGIDFKDIITKLLSQ